MNGRSTSVEREKSEKEGGRERERERKRDRHGNRATTETSAPEKRLAYEEHQHLSESMHGCKKAKTMDRLTWMRPRIQQNLDPALLTL